MRISDQERVSLVPSSAPHTPLDLGEGFVPTSLVGRIILRRSLGIVVYHHLTALEKVAELAMFGFNDVVERNAKLHRQSPNESIETENDFPARTVFGT